MFTLRCFLMALLANAATPFARAQSANKLPRIGVLDPSPSASSRGRMESLRTGLASLGYKEGVHYALEYRSAEGQFERLDALAHELVRLAVRVIVVRNTPGVLAARKATQTIPLIMADVGDPVELGFVQSLAHPGVNVTGLSNATLELLRKRLELLVDTLPSIRQVAVLGNSADQNTKYQNWAAQQRLPVMHAFREEVEAGRLFAYSADLSNHYDRVADYVARILKGTDPATMPIERPTRFELLVNLKTARTIGTTIPALILARADKVIR